MPAPQRGGRKVQKSTRITEIASKLGTPLAKEWTENQSRAALILSLDDSPTSDSDSDSSVSSDSTDTAEAPQAGPEIYRGARSGQPGLAK